VLLLRDTTTPELLSRERPLQPHPCSPCQLFVRPPWLELLFPRQLEEVVEVVNGQVLVANA